MVSVSFKFVLMRSKEEATNLHSRSGRGGHMPITVDLIIDALESLGGEGHLDEITQAVLQRAQKPYGKTPENTIRARLQNNCSESKHFIGEDLFVSVHGLNARKGVWALRQPHLNPSNPDVVFDGVDAFESEEGRAVLRTHLRRERSRQLIREFKKSLKEARCEACSINFEEIYGSYGADYIEAHHKIPVSQLKEGEKTKITDLAPLCANCHRVIHKNPGMTVDDLAHFLAKNDNGSDQRKSWKEAVVAAIDRLVKRNKSPEFKRAELISIEMPYIIADAKSVGLTPSQTLSRVLQELRDEGIIEFTDNSGSYKSLL